MKIAPFDETAFHHDHPAGTVSFNYLLMGGEPESRENYRYILGRQDADFHMPRHRHTFEQIRLPLVGDMNLGAGRPARGRNRLLSGGPDLRPPRRPTG